MSNVYWELSESPLLIIFTKFFCMKVKEEISHLVDTLPEDFLNELLDYLKKLDKKHLDDEWVTRMNE